MQPQLKALGWCGLEPEPPSSQVAVQAGETDVANEMHEKFL